MLGSLAAQGTPGVAYGKVDVDQAGAVAQKMGVRGIPDTRIFHDGKQIGAFTGFRSAEQIQQLVNARLEAVNPQPMPGQANGGAGSIEPAKKGALPPGITPVPAS